MAGFNLADLFELVVDNVADREALVTPARRLTYRELDQRANRLANAFTELGIAAGDHVGLQLLNGSEYLEGMLAAFKIQAVPININFRYVEGELRHLYDDADLVAVIYHRQFSSRVCAVAADLAAIRTLIVVDDSTEAAIGQGAVDYEALLAAASPARPDGSRRTGDDRYIAYTGGTTGLPKGVVWRHEDIFFAGMGGGDVFQSGDFVATPQELPSRSPEVGLTTLTTPPLMHVSAQWGVFHSLFGGGRVVFASPAAFDPAEVWELVGKEAVNILIIVGDAMARPLASALESSRDSGAGYDVSSLLALGSGGAILSASMKQRLAKLLPAIMIVDGFGSSETGVVGSKMHAADDAGGAPTFTVNDQTQVLDDAGRRVAPGSGVVGRLARKGRVPIGYYNDPAKTAATFIEVDGERWVLPGDNALVASDGTVTLLGRGSTSINTGGEKVYPEEVETALTSAAGVADVVVVGVPDEHWGERVVAVVQPVAGATVTLDLLREHAKSALAGYKLPRELVVVDTLERTPAGKPDYKWAKEIANAKVGS